MANDQEQINIIAGCKNNSRKAQEQLYKAYYRAMASLCLRYTRNEEDAVEVLNNGFHKVFKNIRSYDPIKATLFTWIRTIIINSCLDFIKAKQHASQHQQLNKDVEVYISPEILSKIKTEELLQLVRRLSPSTKAVFNLYIMEGYSHKEIAELLGISEGTSRWHLSEARKNLQQMIQQQDVKHS